LKREAGLQEKKRNGGEILFRDPEGEVERGLDDAFLGSNAKMKNPS